MSSFASRSGRALLAAAVITSGWGMLPRGADAQPKSVTDEARELARDGWKAFDAQSYQEALDKVTKAEALYHAPTHLLLMGNAQVALGKLADALATFERLAAEPLPAAAPAAFKDAQETGRKRMKELLARVPSLLVVVESAEAPAATVTVDGKKVDFASGVAVRFDPGEHVIAVEAEGFAPVKRSITLPEKGGVVRVPIVLEKPRAAGSATAGAAAGTAAPSASPGGGEGPSRLPAYVAFGVAGVGLLAGAVTGGVSLAQTSELKGRCPNDVCGANDRAAIDRALTLAHVSTASFAVGGAAAVAGIVLAIVDLGGEPAKPKTSTTGRRGAPGPVHVEPWISLGGAGVRGSF